MAVANVVLNDAGTNSVSYPVVATHTSSGTTAPGFGVGVNFIQENTTYSTNIQVATIESVSTSEADIHNDMVFKTKYNNTLAERARIKNGADFTLASGNFVPSTAGKGIDFSANTGAAGMTSELLDWYEEGDFTPVIEGTTSVGSATYASQIGRYTRVGRAVFFEIAIDWSAGTGTGVLRIAGLPFTSSATTTYPGVSIGIIDSVALTAGNYSTAFVRPNSNAISLRQSPTGGGSSTDVAYDAAGFISLSGFYTV
jgi:hypothetical protein